MNVKEELLPKFKFFISTTKLNYLIGSITTSYSSVARAMKRNAIPRL